MAAAGVSRSMVLTLLGFCVSVLFIVFVCSRLACGPPQATPRPRPPPPRLPFPPYRGVPLHLRRPPRPPPALVGRRGRFRDRGPRPRRRRRLPHPRLLPRRFIISIRLYPLRLLYQSKEYKILTALGCVVCLAEYEEKDVLRVLPYCGHGFHVACIDIWLMHHSTCPVCRISLCDYPDSKHTMSPVPSAVIIPLPPCSPEASRSDQCNCLFVGTGHSPRTSQVLRNEPDQVKLPVILETSTQGDPWIAVIARGLQWQKNSLYVCPRMDVGRSNHGSYNRSELCVLKASAAAMVLLPCCNSVCADHLCRNDSTKCSSVLPRKALVSFTVVHVCGGGGPRRSRILTHSALKMVASMVVIIALCEKAPKAGSFALFGHGGNQEPFAW
ncbi:hypothetical protein OsJ_35228 [Oryza sativa Japonica Group]|uniref:RING-type domain-containing protein n=1 Tax=Oryza sativa subsp. japonica TaxID=39947 RepID=B9GBW8_ORYSJ|nr:hypothetical protein OsJ_35228 [Oryza sativa Japonica Group]